MHSWWECTLLQLASKSGNRCAPHAHAAAIAELNDRQVYVGKFGLEWAVLHSLSLHDASRCSETMPG